MYRSSVRKLTLTIKNRSSECNYIKLLYNFDNGVVKIMGASTLVN